MSLLLCFLSLKLSVYATAGNVQNYLVKPETRARVEQALRRLHVSGIFLEGRRGDEYVPPAVLAELRKHFESRGMAVAGGIATVPGKNFGERQNTTLGWLNWESEKTRRDIAGFFRENAEVFDTLIVDDFFCTADTSPASEKARGDREWGPYRQELLLGLVKPLMRRSGVKLIIKYPQWYDRFHKFGYDPARMSPLFDRVWCGTEVRNPETRRMGYTQPTQGYMNFRWISAVTGGRLEGAWFDHIECTAQNFLDQAWQSVLAGAREITLFHLGDVVEGHPGHALLEAAWPEMERVAERIRGKRLGGVAYYKPDGSDPADNMYLMDYLGMLGVPVVPAAEYPAAARSAILGAQAGDDLKLAEKVERHLRSGARIAMTPALLKKVPALERFRNRVFVWDVRTFSEEDFRETGEWLLPPKPLALSKLPREEADRLRQKLGVPLSAPAGVGLYQFGEEACLYNFLGEAVEVQWKGQAVRVPANGMVWR
jgi:hypothetical protein